MNITFTTTGNIGISAHPRISFFQLQSRLTTICLVNFLVLSLVGLLLRAYPIFSIHLPVYKKPVARTFTFCLRRVGDAGPALTDHAIFP